MRLNMKNYLLNLIVILCLSACSNANREGSTKPSKHSKSGCIVSAEHMVNGKRSNKTRFEQETIKRVRFLGEPENFSAIDSLLKKDKIPALSIALIKQGKIEWADTYQNSDLLPEQKLDCTSLFQAASLSKPVTLLAVLRMVEAGHIDLDRNIQEYLTDFVIPPGKQTDKNPVTFRNILAHRSGITAGGYQGYENGKPIPSDLDVLNGKNGANSHAIQVLTEPNRQLAYSGGGYTLAEVAIQNRLSDSFSNIMQRWILDPVRMELTDFSQPLPKAKWSRAAKGFLQSGESVKGGWHNHPEQAAAGLWSNAIDLAKLLIEVRKGYLGESSVFAQKTIQSMLKDEQDGHVYGFLIKRVGDSIFLTHYGGNAGYRTGMTIDLTRGNGLVYLINSDNGGNLGNNLLLSASRLYGWNHFKQIEVTRTKVKVESLRELIGNYRWNEQIDLSLQFDQQHKMLALIFPNGDRYLLTPIEGEGLGFIHESTGVTVSFSKKESDLSFELYGRRAVKIEVD